MDDGRGMMDDGMRRKKKNAQKFVGLKEIT